MAKMQLKSVLRRLLKERGITALELSRATSVPNSTIATWINSGSAPKRPEQAAAVAQFFGISLHALLFNEPEPNNLAVTEAQTDVVLEGYYKLKLERVIIPKKGKREP